MSVLSHFLLKFCYKIHGLRRCIYSTFSVDFSAAFPMRDVETGRETDGNHNVHTAGHLPKTALALYHVQVPHRLLVANHGRRYVFSQPILDHICICNASHLEHSRPGAQGRRVTHQQWTRQPGTVKTPPSPQSRSSSKKFTFPSPLKRTLCVSNFSQPSRFASTVALSACCHQLSALRHSHSIPLLFYYSCRLSAFSLSHPFPPPLHIARLSHSVNPT